MLIRELTSDDVPRFIEIVKQLSPQASTGVMPDRSVWYDLCRLQNKRVFVAELDGKIVGTISILIEEKVNRGTNPTTGRLWSVAHVEEVIVDNEHRGSNIGNGLMKYAVDYAKLAGAYKVILDCDEEKNGEFYKKCGFRPTERQFRMDLTP